MTTPVWSADPATGAVSYELSAQGEGLSSEGGLCELHSCWPRFEGGRADTDGAVYTVEGALPGYDGDASLSLDPPIFGGW